MTAVLILVLLASGAPAPASETGALSAYIGHPVDELVTELGPPDVVGARRIWRLRVPRAVEARRGLPAPQIQITPQGVTVAPAAGELRPPALEWLACYIEAEVDPENRIRTISATGPGCRHLDSRPRRAD